MHQPTAAPVSRCAQIPMASRPPRLGASQPLIEALPGLPVLGVRAAPLPSSQAEAL
jgi:hypothetical protein